MAAYMSTPFSDTLPTPGFFTAALAADESQNPFEASWKEENAKMGSDKDQSATGDFNQFASIGDGVSTSLLSFSPKTNISVLPQIKTELGPQVDSDREDNAGLMADMDVAPSQMWNASRQENAMQSRKRQSMQPQELSPPQSSSESPPDRWKSFQYNEPTISSLDHLLAEHHPNAPARYGNVTPPEDNSPNPVVAGEALDHKSVAEQQQKEEDSIPIETPPVDSGKRKRSRQANRGEEKAAESSAPKRPRKASNRSRSDASDSTIFSGKGQDDAKRSKFLERNRVAASKCRQKKKEWTGNLEARARELQNAKNQLTVIASSLRDEGLYLKGEMLKHSSCNCASIRDYLNHEVSNIANAKHSRISYISHDLPASRLSSISDSRSPSSSEPSRHASMHSDSFSTPVERPASSLRNSDLASGNHTPSQPGMQGSPSFNYGEADDLHALLSNQLGQGAMGDAFAMRASQ